MVEIFGDAAAALDELLFDGIMICSGGFGLRGIPERLIEAIQLVSERTGTHFLAEEAV